ncbi:DUF4442 domain-containing protein [Parashewanella spongiae]|uniref:DUF4442 domain-containing protein n=1 Tax=Parashewanella spongiae TaxID=342950 RepID=A0A3A6TZR3_9GAMM|nr:hotdog fold domain-containing protein [Parashewanella spongiae]MCL1080018.1 DUF4442 domain-containing protein [Parashewanella spongiae]RJY05852.1 DUF4442 domain-containing protein [Parashewanella spongiae]
MSSTSSPNPSAIQSPPNKVLKLYKKLTNYPLGRWFFSVVIGFRAPYFATISPLIKTLKLNYCECYLRKRWRVQNHIGTVHVIAICNGLEMAMGVLAEASIPKHLRWIPKGMSLDYTAKAGTDIRCVAEVRDAWQAGDLLVYVTAYDKDNVIVVKGVIKLWVSEKPVT